MFNTDTIIKICAVMTILLLGVLFYLTAGAACEAIQDEWTLTKARSVDMAGGV